MVRNCAPENLEIPGLVLGAKIAFEFVALAPSRNDEAGGLQIPQLGATAARK